MFTKITVDAERLQKEMIKTVLREVLVNAMVHNDYTTEVTPVVEVYSDRLCITSYGGLGAGFSKAEFLSGRSNPRNRELMRVFRDLRFVEQLGSGVHRMLDAYDESILNITENFFEVCFTYEKEYLNENRGGIKGGTNAVLTVRQKEVLELIVEDSAISIANAATLMGINRSAIQKHFDKLKEKGVIQRMEGKSGGYWKVNQK